MTGRNDAYSEEWTREHVDACKRAGWYLLDRSAGLPGYYPSDAMRAFRDGYEAGKSLRSTSAAQPVAWFRVEDGIRVYYETQAWPDLTPLYAAPLSETPRGDTAKAIDDALDELGKAFGNDWNEEQGEAMDRVVEAVRSTTPASASSERAVAEKCAKIAEPHYVPPHEGVSSTEILVRRGRNEAATLIRAYAASLPSESGDTAKDGNCRACGGIGCAKCDARHVVKRYRPTVHATMIEDEQGGYVDHMDYLAALRSNGGRGQKEER